MVKTLLFFILILFLTTCDSKAVVIEDPDDELTGISADSSDALTVFSAKIKDKTVYINWRILNIKNISYFKLFRMDAKKKTYEELEDSRIRKDEYFEKSKLENGAVMYKFDFEDEPERDGVYYYKLKAYNSNGIELFESDEIKIGITGIRNFKLDQNTPNPFNPSTVIKYELFEETSVKLKVFDLIGKTIVTLVDQNQGAGSYSVEFDASKFANLTSGIYFYKLETGVSSEVKKMILAK